MTGQVKQGSVRRDKLSEHPVRTGAEYEASELGEAKTVASSGRGAGPSLAQASDPALVAYPPREGGGSSASPSKGQSLSTLPPTKVSGSPSKPLGLLPHSHLQLPERPALSRELVSLEVSQAHQQIAPNQAVATPQRKAQPGGAGDQARSSGGSEGGLLDTGRSVNTPEDTSEDPHRTIIQEETALVRRRLEQIEVDLAKLRSIRSIAVPPTAGSRATLQPELEYRGVSIQAVREIKNGIARLSSIADEAYRNFETTTTLLGHRNYPEACRRLLREEIRQMLCQPEIDQIQETIYEWLTVAKDLAPQQQQQPPPPPSAALARGRASGVVSEPMSPRSALRHRQGGMSRLSISSRDQTAVAAAGAAATAAVATDTIIQAGVWSCGSNRNARSGTDSDSTRDRGYQPGRSALSSSTASSSEENTAASSGGLVSGGDGGGGGGGASCSRRQRGIVALSRDSGRRRGRADAVAVDTDRDFEPTPGSFRKRPRKPRAGGRQAPGQ